MDAKKIAFIIHRTNDQICMETIDALTQLEIPEDFEIELFPVTGAKKFQAYNSAMNQSDAKYKIYLGENVTVLDKNILLDLLKVFQSNEQIGIIGISGAIEFSTHGICLNSAKRCGKIFTNKEKTFNVWGEEKNFVEVESVDGWFIATQYDLNWREDLFDDNYFGDSAQCLEFHRKGYKVFVLNQRSPQIWLRSDNVTVDDKARKIFLEEYSADIFPLVSVVIPTFNRPKYFQEALESVLKQTYRNFEIVVSDNSTEDDTEILMQEYLQKYPNIKYFRHKNFDAHDNWNFARQYNNPQAEYLNWLMDDDIFYPRKFEFMIEIYRNNPSVALVTSIRHRIDKAGEVTGNMFTPAEIPRKNSKLNGEEAMNVALKSMENYIGELTTVLIRKKFLRNNDLCWHDDEPGFYPMNDLLTWCQLLSQGDLFYFYEQPLSAFRQHSGQSTYLPVTVASCEIVWAKIFKSAWEQKIFLKTEEDMHGCILLWINAVSNSLLEAYRENYKSDWLILLEKTLAAMSKSLCNDYKIELPTLEIPNSK